MDKKNNFWRDIYQESRKRVREQLGAKGELLKLMLSILFVVLAIGLLSILGWKESLGISQNVIQIIWILLGGNIVAVIVLLIAEPIIAFFRMFGIAAEINMRLLDVQENFLANAYSKEANFLLTEEINHQDWVGIRVVNQENRFIEGVIRIEAIPESPSFSDSLELKRHGIEGVDVYKLSQNSHNDFDVAIVRRRDGKVGIPHHGGMHFFEIGPGEYHLETHLIGSFQDPPYGLIRPKIEFWRLIYNPNAKPTLQLAKLSDVLSKIKIRAKFIKRKG